MRMAWWRIGIAAASRKNAMLATNAVAASAASWMPALRSHPLTLATLVPTREDLHQGAMSRGRTILADDDVLLREGLASLLERSEFQVVAQAGDGAELVALVEEHGPDLVIVDIRMPPTHTTEGLEAAREIRERFPQLGILVLSARVEVDHAMELPAGGRRIGFLLKSRATNVDGFIR